MTRPTVAAPTVLGAIATLVVLVGLAAMPAHSADAAFWQGTGCALTLTPDAPHVAEVTCQNRITNGQWHDAATLIDGGLIVGLVVDHGPGDVPDLFIVTPPDGFVAVPAQLSLPEHGAGVVLIWQWSGS